MYMTNWDADSVTSINGDTNEVINTIAVGDRPYAIAYNPANGNMYATNFNSDTVSVIGVAAPPPSSPYWKGIIGSGNNINVQVHENPGRKM